MRVIEAARDMRQNGMSLRQIAKFLTKIGVPTKRRGVGWHPEMVKRLLSNFCVTENKIVVAEENCSLRKP
jgi:hypothetical protein